jgi:hypothetical protein
MKILILCEKLDIDHTSSGIGRSKLIYALSGLEAEIDVLYDQFHHADVERVAPVNFIRLEKPANAFSQLKRFPKAGALMNYFTGQNFDSAETILWWVRHIKKQLVKNNYSLIYVLGSGQQWYTFFAMLHVKTEVPFVLNFHDPYPSAYHPEFKRKIHWVEFIRYKKIKKLTTKAFKVTLPSFELAAYLEAYYPIQNKFVIIPHAGLKLPFIKFDRLKKNSRMVITHAGLLLSSRNPKVFITACLELFERIPKARQQLQLNIVGPMNINDEHLDLLIQKNKDWLHVARERISYEQSMKLLNASDVLLLIDFNADFSPIMLGKLGDYFYFQKPIIALTPKKSETSRLLGVDYAFKTQIDNKAEQVHILEELFNLWEKGELSNIDLSRQADYVSEANVCSTFNDQIVIKANK